MNDWLKRTLGEGGLNCQNCGQWRGLYGEQYIEPCPNCGDEEFDIYEVDV